MTLKEYIAAGNTTITQIGQEFGISEHGVRKWVYGQREPDLDTAVKIEAFTSGAVTVAELSKARAAAPALCTECEVRVDDPRAVACTQAGCPSRRRAAA